MLTGPLLLVVATTAAAGDRPADRLPDPQPERCEVFLAALADDDAATPDGLSYDQVVGALNGVIQTALFCPQPPGRKALALTFELTVGCDGIVSSLQAIDTDDAPESYVQCVSEVIAKADFPSHDMADGMPVTYPVNVSW